MQTMKLAQRVEATLRQMKIYLEAKQIEPQQILVAPLNRDGAPPNCQHIHNGLIKSFLEKGFDPSRPQVGILVEFKSAEKKRELLNHNRRFTYGNVLLPNIEEDKVLYGSLAGSHLNLALRLIQQGASSPAGDLRSLAASDASLQDAVAHGHKWFVLRENTDPREQVDISLWRNQDQNENFQTHEIELLQTIMSTAKEQRFASASTSSRGKMQTPIGDLTQRAQRRTPAQPSYTTMQWLTRFFVAALEEDSLHLVNELIDFHAATVNPRNIVVTTQFFQFLSTEEGLKGHPYLRHYILVTQYTDEKTQARAAGPSFSVFLDLQGLSTFLKKPEQVEQLEKSLKDARTEYLPLLERSCSAGQALLDLAVFGAGLIRLVMAKPHHQLLKQYLGKQTGSRSSLAEKLKVLKVAWASWIESKYPDAAFGESSGIKPLVPETGSSDVLVDLGKLVPNAEALEEESGESTAHGFVLGDEVTASRRMTWTIQRPGEASARVGVNVGATGHVRGSVKDKVIVCFPLTVQGSSTVEDIEYAVFPKNIKLTSEYEQEPSEPGQASGHQGEEDGTQDNQTGKKKSEHHWLILESKPEDVRVEKKWTKFLAEDGPLVQNYFLRARIGMLLQVLWENLPKPTEKDLVVAHRMNANGAWVCELWTNRAIKARELCFAPYTPNLKDSHVQTKHSAPITLPLHGPGAHPDGPNSYLSLQGRFQQSIAESGLLEPRDLTGSLYWAVQRISEEDQANMSLESFTWEGTATLRLPWAPPWAGKNCTLRPQNLPHVPLLVNMQPIAAHQRLTVFFQPPKRQQGDKGEEEAPKKKKGKKDKKESKEA